MNTTDRDNCYTAIANLISAASKVVGIFTKDEYIKLTSVDGKHDTIIKVKEITPNDSKEPTDVHLSGPIINIVYEGPKNEIVSLDYLPYGTIYNVITGNTLNMGDDYQIESIEFKEVSNLFNSLKRT